MSRFKEWAKWNKGNEKEKLSKYKSIVGISDINYHIKNLKYILD